MDGILNNGLSYRNNKIEIKQKNVSVCKISFKSVQVDEFIVMDTLKVTLAREPLGLWLPVLVCTTDVNANLTETAAGAETATKPHLYVNIEGREEHCFL